MSEKICEGDKAVLHFYGCVMIEYHTYQARKYSVTETRPYAQYNRALYVNWTEPRKRNGVYKTFAPLRVSDGYCVIEAGGEYVYDSRADVPVDMDAFRATRARFGFEDADEGPPAPALREEQRASHQADLDRERETQERYEATYGKPESKMTREEFDTRQRGFAQEMIDTGDCNYLGYASDGPSRTSAERDDIERLKPDVIKTVRAACGVIERDIRRRFPEVAALMRDYSQEREDALSPSAHGAFLDLLNLHSIRQDIKRFGVYDQLSLNSWPARYERPTSPPLRQLFTIYDQADQRWKDKNRERGRKWLARIDSGEAWQQELENRTR